MKWFKHDTDASIDAKLQELLLDYGASGYGLYWYCVELIAQGVNENNITFELEHDARIIARNLNLTIQETKDMMKKMVELDLFCINKNEKLACYALAKRLDKSMTSNQHFRDIISQIKENHDEYSKSHDTVMINPDLVMQEEKRREEIREEENRKENNMSGKPSASVFSVDVISYLNSKAGTNYRQHIKKTIGLIQARINEGFTLDDFKTVIDKKVLLWKNDTKMQAYLRPETLFGTKFESYLNEIVPVGNHIDQMVKENKISPHAAQTMAAGMRIFGGKE